MPLLWWQQLPLFILIQLLEPNSWSSCQVYAEAVIVFNSPVASHQRFNNIRVGKYACPRHHANSKYHDLKDQGVGSLNSGFHPLQERAINWSPFVVDGPPSHTLQATVYKSRKWRMPARVDEDSNVPTLTPLQAAHVKKPGEQRVAAIVGGIGAALLVLVIIVLVYFCLMRFKRFIRRTSDLASSAPSPPVETGRGNSPPHVHALSPYDDEDLRQLTITELENATSSFSQSNIIGEGGFGLVYKGLLQDGSIVAIKRRLYALTRNFVDEVKSIARVHHKHLVKLIGYSEDSHQQLLVYDYISNGNIGKYLYDSGGMPIGKLDLRQRLSIALGAAKGLQHLHDMVPPLFHMHFRTSNVLVDENYTAKVSDFGLSRLLIENHRAGSSSAIDCFLDPELKFPKDYSETSDVFSFGIFLLELVSGREACGNNQLYPDQNIVQQAKGSLGVEDFVDEALRHHTGVAAEHMFKLVLLCIDKSSRRPSMKSIVEALEWIQEREISHLHYELGEEIGAVTLGSELFR